MSAVPDNLRALFGEGEPAGRPSLSWLPVDLGPYLRGEFVVAEPALLTRSDAVALLYPGRTHLLIGETESAKTWLAQQAGAEELKAGRHVVFLDYEDGAETAIERFRELGVSDVAIESCLTYLNPDTPFRKAERSLLCDAIELKGPPALAIVDSLTDAMTTEGLDPKDGPDVSTFYRGAFAWFADRGAAVVGIDHVTKSTDGRGRWAIGSERKISGLTGAAYNVEMVTPFGRQKTGRVTIRTAKDRPGYVRQHEDRRRVVAEVELKSWPDGGVTVHVEPPEVKGDEPFRPTHVMAKVFAAVQATPGLSKTAVRTQVRGKHDVADLALELLIAEGYVGVRLGARGAREHHAMKTYNGD